MKTTYSTPQWAIELVEQVCKDYARSKPLELQWFDRTQNTKRMYIEHHEDGRRTWQTEPIRSSSGTTWAYRQKIHISAGSDVKDQKLVLLHELAHHILNKTKKGRGQGHTTKFWKLAFELYERYGIDMKTAFNREKGYRATAAKVYEKHYKKEES